MMTPSRLSPAPESPGVLLKAQENRYNPPEAGSGIFHGMRAASATASFLPPHVLHVGGRHMNDSAGRCRSNWSCPRVRARTSSGVMANCRDRTPLVEFHPWHLHQSTGSGSAMTQGCPEPRQSSTSSQGLAEQYLHRPAGLFFSARSQRMTGLPQSHREPCFAPGTSRPQEQETNRVSISECTSRRVYFLLNSRSDLSC